MNGNIGNESYFELRRQKEMEVEMILDLTYAVEKEPEDSAGLTGNRTLILCDIATKRTAHEHKI